jgi:hypothetical protein
MMTLLLYQGVSTARRICGRKRKTGRISRSPEKMLRPVRRTGKPLSSPRCSVSGGPARQNPENPPFTRQYAALSQAVI